MNSQIIKKWVIMFSLLICCSIYGQQQIIDSIKNLAETYQVRDTLRASYLLLTADFTQQQNPNKALEYVVNAEEIANELNWERGKALINLQKGTIYYIKADYIKAIDFFQKAEDINRKVKDPRITMSAYNNKANIYAEIGEIEKSIEYNKKVYEFAVSRNDIIMKTVALTNLGNTNKDIEKYKEAIAYYKQALLLTDNPFNSRFKPSILNNMAICYQHLNDYDNAIDILNKSLKLAKSLKDSNVEVASYITMADVLIKQEQYDKAYSLLKIAFPIVERLKNIQWESSIFYLFHLIHIHNNEHKKALDTYKKFIELDHKVLDEKKKRDLIKRDLNFEMQQRDILAKEEIKRKELSQLYTLYGAIGVVIFLIGFGLLYRKRNQANTLRKEAELRSMVSETELIALRAKLDPHFISNALNAIRNYVLKNDVHKASDYLSKFSEVMRGVLKTSDKLFISLKKDIELIKLYMEIEKIRFEKQLRFYFKIDEKLETENILFPPLLLQPLLENSIKYGIFSEKDKVMTIEISIQKVNNQLYCCVEDNGKGRNLKFSKSKKNGVGLNIVEKRLALINAAEDVSSALEIIDKSQGVKVNVILPLKYIF